MIYSGALILLWFLFVIITSLFDSKIYSGGSMDIVLFLGMAIIAVAAVINISLSIDLIAEAKIKELKQSAQPTYLRKNVIKWGLGTIVFFILSAWIGDYFIQRNRLKEFQVITAEVVKAHRGSLEKIFEYVDDSLKISKTKEILKDIKRSNDKVFQAEVIMIREVNDQENWIEINTGSDSVALVNLAFEKLVFVPFGDEKKLIQQLIEGSNKDPLVLELEKGEIRGYYPIIKNGNRMVIRLSPIPRNNGRGK
ncbi:hypothetical protein [Algoriphagus taiwanensis]